MALNDIRTLKTVETTILVLNTLRELEGAGVTEMANYLDLSKGAVYNHLVTLREQGYVVKRHDKYHLGARFINLGKFVQHHSHLYVAGKQEIDKLAQSTGEYAHLMVEENGRGYYVYRSEGENAIATEFHEKKTEEPDYLHHCSTGKAVLSELNHDQIEAILDEHGLPAATDATITSREELFDEIEATRERGYAIYDGEELLGTRAIGVAINDRNGDVLGAVSVSGPVTRMSGETFEKEIPEQVQQAANLIEINLHTDQ